MAGEARFVGRTVELERVMTGLTEEEHTAFVLAGAAGVGKTRLAVEVLRRATDAGYATAQVLGTKAAASIPFAPFAPLLPDPSALSGGKLALLRSAGEALMERAGASRRLLLVVDDAHLLDDGSAALVHQLVHTATCRVLAGVRTPGPAPDPITALWKDGLAERVDLAPLTEAEVATVASDFLGGPVAGKTVRLLFETSGGNALYLGELLRGASESGSFVDRGGVWLLRQPLRPPERLVELVTARLGELAPATLEVLDVLAVAGSLGFELLEQITSAAGRELAEQLGLIEVDEDGRRSEARLAHPLYGEVLRQRLPRSRRRRLTAVLAKGLAGTGGRRREDLLRLASWQLDAGIRDDPHLLARAATRARQMFDTGLAGRLARASLDAGGGVEAGLVLAESEFTSGRHAEAEELLAGLAERCTSDGERARVANARAYNLAVLMGDPERALEVIDDSLAPMTDPEARLSLLLRGASFRFLGGDPDGALEAVASPLASEDATIASRATYVASCALALLGRTEEAVAVAKRGLDLHRRSTDQTQLPEAQLVGAVIGRLGSGLLAEAEAAALEGYGACLEAGDGEGMATFSQLLGWSRLERGSLAAAAQGFREGAAINRELLDTGALRWCLGGVALAEGMAGSAAAAGSAIAELDELRQDWMILFEADLVDRGRAWAKVAAGEISAARQVLAEAALRAAERHEWISEARLLHDVARLGSPREVTARLAELAGAVDGELVAAFHRHAGAVSESSAVGLEAAAHTFAGLGAVLLAAEAASEAAAAYRAAGRGRQASACERLARQLASECGEAHTPSLASTSGGERRLTPREREVAGMAASGASSKEIAARLYVSVRTVDNHLQAAYTKLGVSSRDELAGALGASR